MRVKQAQGARTFHQSGCAALMGAPCVIGYRVPHTACEIMGPSRGFSDRMIKEAMDSQLSHRATAAQHDAIRDRMARWGEPLYHAVARVMGQPCHCAPCKNPSDPRHAWTIADPS